MKKTFLFLLLMSALTSAQDYVDSLKVIEENFKSFRYADVIQKTSDILQYQHIPPDTLINIYMMKGISHFTLQEDTLAKNSFLEIVKIDSSYSPDSVIISPKIVNFFNDVKKSYLTSLPRETEEPVVNIDSLDSLYLPLYQQALNSYSDTLKNSLIRSLLFPGWGHIYTGDSKGWYLTFAGGLTFVSSVYFIIQTENKHSEYLNEKNPELVSSKYDSYNSYYKVRNISIILYGAVWLFSQFDLFTSSIDNFPVINLDITPSGLANLSFKISF
jgi:hypothetical protein